MVRWQLKPLAKSVALQCSKLAENNFPLVFKTFRKYASSVPLEVFGKHPYKTLISTLLSARTKDEVTLEASNRLFKIAPSLKSLKLINKSTIQQIIYPVGFYKTKAKHLTKLAKMITKVPDTREELMKLPGVGRKTANLVLNRAFRIPAIAVDTHVHRISNLLGWVHTKTPEQTEIELQKVLPKKYWPETNKLMVGLGRGFTSKKKLEEFLRKEKLI